MRETTQAQELDPLAVETLALLLSRRVTARLRDPKNRERYEEWYRQWYQQRYGKEENHDHR